MEKIISRILAVSILGLYLSFSTAQAAETSTNIKADVIEYNTASGTTVATGNVRIEQAGNIITAPSAEYNTKTASGKATGGVVATHENGRMNSDTLIVHDQNHLTAIGNAVVVQADKTLKAEQIEYYKDSGYAETVGGWSELSMTDGSKVTADKLTYDERVGLVNAVGNVHLRSVANDLTGQGNQAVYDTRSGDVELLGNATATQQGNTITGERLKITGNGNTASADGKVRLVYIPEEKPVTA